MQKAGFSTGLNSAIVGMSMEKRAHGTFIQNIWAILSLISFYGSLMSMVIYFGLRWSSLVQHSMIKGFSCLLEAFSCSHYSAIIQKRMLVLPYLWQYLHNLSGYMQINHLGLCILHTQCNMMW